MSDPKSSVQDTNYCNVLRTLIQKHARVGKWLKSICEYDNALSSNDKAKQLLKHNHLERYIDEVQFISSNQTKLKQPNESKMDDNEAKVIFHITGFGKFGNIKHNPTTHLIDNLPKYLSEKMPRNAVIASMNVLHVSGVKSLQKLNEVRKSNASNNAVVVYLHFGVAAGRSQLCLESCAYNCANFSIADELGWKPNNEMIVQENKNVYHEYYSTLPIETLVQLLQKDGYKVRKSTDPGRYVCNWIFYNSLHLSDKRAASYSLFVHVPQFTEINEETQCKFAVDLISNISSLLSWKHFA